MTAKRVIFASIVLFFFLVCLTGVFVYTQLRADAEARFWVDHTHQVIEENQALLSQVRAAEGAQRGYLLDQNPAFLISYDQAVAAARVSGFRLAALVRDNSDEVRRVGALRQTIESRLERLKQGLTLVRAGSTSAAWALADRGVGADLMRRCLEMSHAVTAAEQVLLESRDARAERVRRVDLGAGLAVALTALLGLLAAVFYLERANRHLAQALVEGARARAERESSSALTRAIFANSPDYLVVVDIVDGDRFVLGEINPAFERAIGVPAAAIKGRSIDELMPAETAARAKDHYRRVRSADEPVLSRDLVPGLPGGPRTWESILAPVKNTDGVTDRIVGAIRDITERVRTEERLRDAQRMEAIGKLTGGVAHDFNNLLQVIRGNLELLESAAAQDEGARKRLANAIHAADRAAQLTKQLLAFARRQPLEPQVINLARVVTEMSDLLRRTLGERIEVETVIGGGLWNTMADPAQVESAILNLALNARDAMPTGGSLTIEITNASLDDAYVGALEGVGAGQYVLIAVSDTGEGMPGEVRERAFEPFFTTKADGKGSGLGLSMVYGFVRQSGGHVRIYSEGGQGTTIRIYLPRSTRQVSAPVAATAAPVAGAAQTVLVVEDEKEVRSAAVGLLEELGYRCLEAPDAQSALETLGDGSQIDLVFTDVVMPGPLRTRDFADRVRAIAPGMPILFTSGYTENAIVHHGRLDEGVNLISKPYARLELARKVAQILKPRSADASPAGPA